MSKKDVGILIYHEWFDAMEQLSAKEFKALMTAIYHYQKDGTEPPEFKAGTRMIASIIFPCITRRKKLSEYGKKGGEARAANALISAEGEKEHVDEENGIESKDNTEIDLQPFPASMQSASSHPSSTASSQRIEKNKIKKNSISIEERVNKDGECCQPRCGSFDTDSFYEAAVRRSLAGV